MKQTGILMLLIMVGVAPAFARSPSVGHDLAWAPAKGYARTASKQELSSAGQSRRYLIHAPAGDGPFPVVLLLHGGTQSARTVWEQTSLPTLAAKFNFILVAPDGVNGQWNDGRSTTLSGKSSTADDVGFLKALIARVVADNHGDAARVYVTGGSNGGEMTYRMVCEASELFAAAAPVIATLPVKLSQSCKPQKPVQMLMTFGMDDPIMNYEGGTTNRRGQQTEPMLSADATVKFWADANGCGGTSTQFQLPDLDPKDGTTIRRTIFNPCTSGKSVGSMVIQGGGHTWPNSPSYNRVVTRVIGRSTYDIDAGMEIWKFFSGSAQ
jgi:polyhydroxybutyrate depolymerase